MQACQELSVRAALIASLLLSIGASEAADSALTEQADRKVLETVTVLGSKQSQAVEVGSRLGLSLKDTPASVAIVTRDLLVLRGDHSTAQAVARVPGFAPVGMTAFAGSALAARGFTGNNSVAQLYDGNRLFVSGGAMSFPVDTWPFERVEVLAGPASVLYGAGSIGGAVNYVPRQIPENRRLHEAFVGLGSWGTRRVALASAGPASEKSAYRINGVFNTTDGFVDRNNNDRGAASAAYRVDIGPSVALMLMYDGGQIDDTGYFGTPLINNAIDPRTRRLNYNVSDARASFRNDWTRASLEWQARETVALSSEAYFLDTTREFRNVENYTYNPMTGLINRSFNFGTDIAQSQQGNRTDVRLSASLAGRPNRLLLGFEWNRIRFGTANFTTGASAVDPLVFTPGLFNNAAGTIPTLGTETTQGGVFAENVYELTDRLKIVGGVRAETIRLDRLDKITGNRVDLDFEPLTWRLGAVFSVLPTTSVYGQFVTGNDAAGSLISLPAANAAKLQTGRQWEVGAKQTLWQGKADWTLAVYGIEKDDLVSRDPRNPTVAQQIGRQSSRGVELSLALMPSPALSIDLNAALLEAKFDEFDELVSGIVVSRSGNLPPNTPEKLANAYVAYRVTESWEIGGGARYVGARFSNNANTLAIPSYVVADAFVSYRWQRNAVVTARVRNLGNAEWVVAPYNAGAQWSLGDPRSYELSAHFDF